MWIFTSESFVSVVQHRDDPDILIVRGRFEGDAARFLDLPLEAEEVTPAADYRFRCYAHRDVVSAAVLRSLQRVDYANFKKTVKASWRERLYLGVWSLLFREQSSRVAISAQRREATARRLGELMEPVWNAPLFSSGDPRSEFDALGEPDDVLPGRWRTHELTDSQLAKEGPF